MSKQSSCWLHGKKGNEIGLYILTFGKPQAMGAEAILSVYPWLTELSITLKSNKC